MLGFFINGSDTFSMFGSNYSGLAKNPVKFGPNGPLPSQWTDEGFTQRASPLIWPPNATVDQEPYAGFPVTYNDPPIDLVGSVTGRGLGSGVGSPSVRRGRSRLE